jgi:hypothetical protein
MLVAGVEARTFEAVLLRVASDRLLICVLIVVLAHFDRVPDHRNTAKHIVFLRNTLVQWDLVQRGVASDQLFSQLDPVLGGPKTSGQALLLYIFVLLVSEHFLAQVQVLQNRLLDTFDTGNNLLTGGLGQGEAVVPVCKGHLVFGDEVQIAIFL